jgi:hypothetical protein
MLVWLQVIFQNYKQKCSDVYIFIFSVHDLIVNK